MAYSVYAQFGRPHYPRCQVIRAKQLQSQDAVREAIPAFTEQPPRRCAAENGLPAGWQRLRIIVGQDPTRARARAGPLTRSKKASAPGSRAAADSMHEHAAACVQV